MNRLLLTSWTLAHREVVHFFRQRNRVTGALLQPLLMWFLIGSGLNGSFQPIDQPNTSYIDFFFVGILLMILLFTAIFSTFSIIEDRQTGFLQGVLVAPVPRAGIVLGKVLGGTVLGLIQTSLFLFLLLTPMVSLTVSISGLLLLVGIMAIVAFMLTALGTAIAWSMDSTQGFHAIMSVVLLPLWVFSGAPFPVAGVPVWLEWLMRVNPLTHGLDLMRACFTVTPTVAIRASMPSAVYIVVATLVFFFAANRVVCRST